MERFDWIKRYPDPRRFENPTWREVVGLVTGAATPTEVDCMDDMDIGVAMATKARNRFLVFLISLRCLSYWCSRRSCFLLDGGRVARPSYEQEGYSTRS